MKIKSTNNKDNISSLGFGLMRLPKKGNGFDVPEIESEIRYAIDNGVTYFDTAYIYPGSEEVFGEVLSKIGARDKINIASKMPHYFIKDREDLEKKFAEQLRRLRTDHIDYYLMHMLPDVSTWEALKQRGVADWIEAAKASGAIRRIGFSYHGSTQRFSDILNAYSWDFCQIQYNYLDENSQAGRRGLLEAAAKGIPVIIMEPLRGGRLVNNLPAGAQKVMEQSAHNWTNAEWGLKWLMSQPEVTTVLSGMNSLDMVKENIRIASETEENSLTEEDFKCYDKIKAEIEKKVKVGCTGCGYCMPCPKGVDIPGCFRAYNDSYIDNYAVGIKEYFMNTAMKKDKTMASLCAKCGMCEKKCPQQIQIRDELVKVKKRFEKPIFNLVTKFTDRSYRKR